MRKDGGCRWAVALVGGVAALEDVVALEGSRGEEELDALGAFADVADAKLGASLDNRPCERVVLAAFASLLLIVGCRWVDWVGMRSFRRSFVVARTLACGGGVVGQGWNWDV